MRATRNESRTETGIATAIAAALAIALALAIMALFAGCTLTQPPAGSLAGGEMIHHNWWNYYARGQARLAAGDAKGAGEDFERAIGVRPGARFGYDEERWRDRTYGMHVITNYFPNRELGICLLRQGQTADAVRYLEKSLQKTPSGRAKHYLNLAHRTQTVERDIPAPRVVFADDSRAVWCRERTRVLNGAVEGEGRIASLTIADRPEFVELAEPRRAFSRSIDLAPGTNVITVSAVDLKGQASSEQLAWIADWSPPRLALTDARKVNDSIEITLSCRDDYGVAAVGVDGRMVYEGDAATRGAHVVRKVTVPAGRPASLTVRDYAGNELVTELPRNTLAALVRPSASAWCCSLTGAAAAPMMLAASAAAGGPDTLAPDLRLPFPERALSVACRGNHPEFFVDGTVEDGGGLASLTINGEPQLTAADAGARVFRFAKRLPIVPGTNMIAVVARDRTGNQSQRTITVIGHTPDYQMDAYRLRLGVTPFTVDDNVAPSLSGLSRNFLIGSLTQTPPRFYVLDRDPGVWDAVCRELNISLSQLSDRTCALKAGKMATAEYLLMSGICAHRGPQGTEYTVFSEVVDVEQGGRVVAAADVYCRDDEAVEIRRQLSGLSLKVEAMFPLCTGKVVAVKKGALGSKARLDIGAASGVREGTRFMVLTPNEEGREWGEPWAAKRAGESLIQLSVVRPMDVECVADILPGEGEVREGDVIYAR